MHCRHLLILGLLACSWPHVRLGASESLEERRARLERMSSAEKDELRRNQERLMKLDQQQQLRDLERQLADDPQGDRLRKVMLQYHEWLSALPSAARADLLSLPEEQRIPKIQEMLEEQKTDRLRELAKESLTSEDVDTVRTWLGEMVMSRKSELLKQLPERVRNKLADSQEPRRIMFEWVMHNKESHKPPVMTPSALRVGEEDRQRLVKKLSPKAQEFYRKSGTTESGKQAILQNWVVATLRPHRPSTQELQEFLTRLPQEVRDRVENLPPEQMKAELTRLYFDYRRWYQDGKRPPPPGERKGDRPGEMQKQGFPPRPNFQDGPPTPDK